MLNPTAPKIHIFYYLGNIKEIVVISELSAVGFS